MTRRTGAPRAARSLPAGRLVLAAALLCTLAPPAAAGNPAKDFLRAVRLDDRRAIEAYLETGGSPMARDRDGRPALHVAVRHAHVGVVRRLLAAGAAVDARDADGWTALHFAAEDGDLEALALLLEAGADVTSIDPYRYAPLHLAAREGHDEACEVLIAAGADPRAAIDVGFTAADLAERFPELQDRLRALERR